MANKRIADDFLYGNREQRKERRTLRKKNILERKVYKRNAKRLGDPSSYTNAMLGQMKTDDQGEMAALKHAQDVYTPIINSNRSLSNSLSNVNQYENQLYGSPQTTVRGNNLDTKGIINVPDKKKDNPIKKIIGNIQEGIKTRKLRKQALKTEYNNFIKDIKLIEGDKFDEDRVPSYRKWKKKWNKGDMMGVGLSDEDRNKLEALAFNKGKPMSEQKVFHNGKYILRSELEKTINPVTGGNIQEREAAVLENRPEKFSNFDHLFKWQTQAGNYEFKDGEVFQIGKDSYTYKLDDGSGGAGFVPTAASKPKKTDKSLYSYQKAWDLADPYISSEDEDFVPTGPLAKWRGNMIGYFAKYAPSYDYGSSGVSEDFDKYVEISQGWWGSDKGKEYKGKHNIKRKKQTGGIRQYQTGGVKGEIVRPGGPVVFTKDKNGNKIEVFDHTQEGRELARIFGETGVAKWRKDEKKTRESLSPKQKKQTGGCKECGGMYQDGGFLSPPVPRLFED
tara:strand:- start:1020 stop:2534 length:1515 start_codon:yes stop_codon:yes gene_type:complete